MHRIEGKNAVADRFVSGPPATCLTPEFLNSIQEEICNVIEGAGLVVQRQSNDTMNQLFQAIQTLIPITFYDAIVDSQADLNNIIERIGANHYHIKDAYKTVLIRNVGIAYACSGATSFLSGGDAYGYIETNLCTHLKFENGAYFDFGTSIGYIKVNTANSLLENVCIKGSTTTASAVAYGFYIDNVDNVTLENCGIDGRYTSSGLLCFYCLTTTSSKLVNCYVNNLKSSAASGIVGFSYCYNLVNCRVMYSSLTLGVFSCFDHCNNLVGCSVVSCSSNNDSIGFSQCTNLSSCSIVSFSTTSSIVYGFQLCSRISASSASILDTGDNRVYAFYNCSYLSSCYADDIDNNSAASKSCGFVSCNYMSACYANNIDNAGGAANGFDTCNYIASSNSTEATNPTCDYVNTDDVAIGTNFSCPAIWT